MTYINLLPVANWGILEINKIYIGDNAHENMTNLVRILKKYPELSITTDSDNQLMGLFILSPGTVYAMLVQKYDMDVVIVKLDRGQFHYGEQMDTYSPFGLGPACASIDSPEYGHGLTRFNTFLDTITMGDIDRLKEYLISHNRKHPNLRIAYWLYNTMRY